jgi:hypothetical protein
MRGRRAGMIEVLLTPAEWAAVKAARAAAGGNRRRGDLPPAEAGRR